MLVSFTIPIFFNTGYSNVIVRPSVEAHSLRLMINSTQNHAARTVMIRPAAVLRKRSINNSFEYGCGIGEHLRSFAE
jgi:hypothetical protein